MQFQSWLPQLFRRLRSYLERQRVEIRRRKGPTAAVTAVVRVWDQFHSSAHHLNAVRQRVRLATDLERLEARALLSATTTNVAVSDAAPVYGSTEVFTATVTDGGNTVSAGGTVTFYVGATILGISPVDNNGQATYSTSSLSAGSYQISAAYSGYLAEDPSSSGLSVIDVTPATPTINLNTYNATYNGVAHVSTGSATGINGTNLDSYLDLSGTSHTSAGTYTTDSWSFHDPSGNYSDASGTITNVIGKANATFVVTPYSTIYDGLSHTAVGVALGVGGENLSSLLSFTSQTQAGNYTDTWTFAGNDNYLAASGAVNDTITPAVLTVTADSQTKVYGTDDSTLTFSVTGFKSTDTESSVLTGALTRTTGEDVGTYTINRGTLEAGDNYTISYTSANQVITKATLTISADSQTKVYGSIDPTLTYDVSGLQFSDTAGSVLTGSLARAAGENVFTYAINQGTLAANGNYAVNFTGNDLTVTKAELTVTASSLTKIYGASDPTLTYIATGFQFADVGNTVLSGSLSRTTGEDVGTYAIGQGSLVANGNYTLTFTGDELTITPATLTVSVNSQTKVYGTSDPTLSYVVNGLQFSDSLGSVLSGDVTRATGEDVGRYAISQGSLEANANYSINFTGNNLAITKAVLTVQANALTKVYGASDPTLSYLTTGLQFSDDAATVLSGALTRATGEDVGGYAISQGTLAADSNYTLSFTGSNLAITKATLTVTADAQTKVYGTTDPTLTYVTTGLQFSDTASGVLTGILSRASGENVFSYAINQGTLTANGNYSVTFVGNNLAITKATLTVTANPLNKTYGATDPSLTYVATGFQFADIAATVLSGSVTRATGENVGMYAISQGSLTANGNYTLSFTGDDLTITPATLMVSANAQTKVYGASDPTLSYSTTGLKFSDTVSGVLTGALARSTGEDVGTYAIDQGTLAANGNYSITFTGNNLAITKAVLTVRANTETKVYGDADPTLAYVVTGFQLTDDASTTLTGALARETGENVGNYAIDQGTLAANGNYSINFTGNHLAITKAVLVVTADAQTKVYGTVDPRMTYVTTGLQFSDTVGGVLTGTLSRTAGENVFTYAINQGTLAANGNYSLNFVGNDLTITKAALTVTADPKTKVYGASDPSLTYVATGFQFADIATTVITGGLTRATGEDVGTYAIGQGTLAANGNYSITFTSDDLTITPATLNVSANAQSKIYGSSDPTLTFVTTGLKFSDTVADVLTGALARAAGEDVGSYAVSQGTLVANNNYTITFTRNNFAITKATITVTADSQTKVYGSVDPTFTYVTTGLAFSDDAASILTGSLTRVAGENTGTYAIGQGSLATNGNYTITFIGDNLTITKATLDVTANTKTKILNTADPTLTYSVSGLQFSDTANRVLSGVLARDAGEEVGDYAINQGTLAANSNYTINYTSDNLTIWDPARAVVFKSFPATVTAGVKFAPSLKVSVVDANGDVVTTDRSLVTIRVASGPGDFTAESTLTVAAVNGIATFNNLIINTSGSYTVSISDGSLTTATSTAITINPAAASQVLIQQAPTSGTAGVALNPSILVAVQDKFGNFIQTPAVVTLSLSGSFGSGRSSISAASVNGLATFNNVIINKSGAYSLRASFGAISSTSLNLNISPAAASKVAFLQPPTANVSVGTAFTPAVTVAVQDQFGNTVTNSSDLVTLTLSTGTFSNDSATVSATAQNGIATFDSLIINKIGTYKLTANVSTMTASTQNFSVVAGALSSLTVAQAPTTGTAGVALGPAIKIAAWDQFGNAIPSPTTVTLSLTSGEFATKSATVTASTNGGVATFSSVIFNTAGTYTLTPSVGGVSGPSFNITISAGAAKKLAFQHAPPTTGTAGLALSPSVVVSVQDNFGNQITTDSSSVTLTLTGGTFNNGATTVTANAVNGLATFNDLTINKVGTNYTLTASDGSMTKVTSARIAIAAGAISQLAFQAVPPKGTAGVALSPAIKVLAQDAFGNVVTTDTSTVTLTLNTGAFNNGSSTSTATVVNGIAVFDSLIINKTGTYQLTASAGHSVTTATSRNIVVSSNVLNSLVVQQKPTTGTAGAALGTAVIVQALDQYGNLLTTSSTVKLALSSGQFSTKATSVQVTTVGGVATFNNLIFNAAGTYTLTASVNSITTSSFNVTIGAAAASKLVITQAPPATVTAGVALSPTVTVSVVDAFGNVVTTDTSTVTLTISAGTFGSGAATVTATAINGVATFSGLTINKSGTYKLTASDSASLTTAVSQNIVVKAGAAASLSVQQKPTTGVAGANLSPAIKIAILDAYGNVVLTDASTVTLTLDSGTFKNGSNTASMAASSGIASFTGLSIRAAGSYTFTVSDGSLAPVTFSVTIN